jgi:hypothetical protein
MQFPLLSNLAVSCDKITPLEPAVPFDCVVDGKKLKATITHQEDNGIQFIYHISFSDGYTATFVAPLEAGSWHEEALASPYAMAIRDDLNAFCGFLPQKPPIAIRLKSHKEAFNVWVVPHIYTQHQYAVFYKGTYRFDLRNTKIWEAKSVREGHFIDEEIASLVCRNIEQRMMQPQLWSGYQDTE